MGTSPNEARMGSKAALSLAPTMAMTLDCCQGQGTLLGTMVPN